MQENNTHTPNQFSPRLADTIWRGISTLSLMLIVWTLSTVNELKQDRTADKLEISYLKEGIDEIKEAVKVFTSEPRFTQGSFNDQIQPLSNTVSRHDLQIDNISPILSDIQERLIRVEIKLDDK